MLLKSFPRNERGRDFVVGDIHGCFRLLEQGLERVSFDRTVDRLFCCGDLVDRGPESHLAAEYVLERAWFHSVAGNHEAMIADPYSTDVDTMLRNGGAWWFLLSQEEKRTAMLAFSELPLAIEVDTPDGMVGIVHAEVPGHDWNNFRNPTTTREHLEHHALWGRQLIQHHRYSGLVPDRVANIDKVYVGHSIVKGGEPLQLANVRYIDTGAFATNVLTIERIA